MFTRLRRLDFLLRAAEVQRKLHARFFMTNNGAGRPRDVELHNLYIREFNSTKYWWMTSRKELNLPVASSQPTPSPEPEQSL